MTSVDADLRSGRQLETGRRFESIIYTVKPVYKDHSTDSREPENVAVMSRCPLYTG